MSLAALERELRHARLLVDDLDREELKSWSRTDLIRLTNQLEELLEVEEQVRTLPLLAQEA